MTTNVPLGPVGQILVDKRNRITGECVRFFWPQSGRPYEFLVRLKTSSGLIHEAPFCLVENRRGTK
jgi:hypothetical protein